MINNQQNILVIDDDTEFTNKLSQILLEYEYNVIQTNDKTAVFENIQLLNYQNDLILLKTNYKYFSEVYTLLQNTPDVKIILLSNFDDIEKREIYFSNGILDYYVTDIKVEYIADDIVETLTSLKTNTKETILIIDNSIELCNTLKNILNKRNYQVFIATNAQEGLEILKSYEISLLILDMELSDIKSLDLLKGLRDLYLLNQFFVLATAKEMTPSRTREALKSGVCDFLKKPFFYEELILKIDILVSSSSAKKTIIEQNNQIENNFCVDCNYEAITLLGFKSKSDILQKDMFQLFPDISKKHKEELIESNVNNYFEDNIINNKNEKFQVQFKEKNVVIDNKNIKIVAAIDVTDIKQQEKALSHQQKMISMGEMMANIAHQWRQPLTAISIAASGIKLNYELDIEERVETIVELENIVENTKFLSETVESFQNFLKLDKEIVNFSIIKALRKTISIIGANLESNEIKIVENYEDDYAINGIENEMIQVFLNIINNAADVLKQCKDKRYIFISIQRSKDNTILSFRDNANGIDKKVIEHIFEPYFTTKHQAQGTGLGLYMTHQILKKMGLNIKVINENFCYEGKNYYGANFQIVFPLNKEI